MVSSALYVIEEEKRMVDWMNDWMIDWMIDWNKSFHQIIIT